jgi:hypothetical protein
MKLAINRKPVEGPWGGGNKFVKAVYDTAPPGVEITNFLSKDVDTILLIDPRRDGSFDAGDAFKFSLNRKVQVIQRINECDARKGTEHMDSLLLQCSVHNTKTIFVSEWMRGYFASKGWACKNQFVLVNGVDDCFFETSSSQQSFDKIRVVTHHWSNNIMKGFDAYDFVDYLSAKNSKIAFTYVGRDRGSFTNCRVVPPLHGKQLAEELSRHDVYISGSRSDPGPNHVLEAIAVGLPTYVHAEGGGAVEFAGREFSYKNFHELEKILFMTSHSKNAMFVPRWSETMSKFWSIVTK